jgi:hypothetical protein
MASVADRTVFRIEGEVDANWRGAYDLLVRPPGARLGLERTNGVVEPNFISFAGSGGISLAQLDAVRRVEAVEVAAPVSFVGYVRYVPSSPVVHLPAPPSQPTLYRVSLSATTSDGVHELLVQRQEGLVLLGPGTGPQAAQSWTTNFGSISGGQRKDGTVVYDLSGKVPLPAIASPIMAVDPTAEAELLGPSAAFMARLAGVAPESRTVADFDHESIPDTFGFARSQLRFASRSESDAVRDRPVVPLVVSSRIYASLGLRLEVEQVGDPLRAYPPGDAVNEILKAALAEAGTGERSIGVSQSDLSGRLHPLQLTEVAVSWPGVTDFETVLALSEFNDFVAGLPTRPNYNSVSGRPGSDVDLHFKVSQTGIVGPDGGPPRGSSNGDGLALQVTTGREAAYREFREVALAAAKDFSPAEPGDQPFYFAPLGEFDLSRLDLPVQAVSYVPYGAYDPPQTEWLGSGLDTPPSPVQMSPTLNPAGLIMVPPLAITDLEGAVVLRGDRPIDAIRIRVSGVSGFTPDARSRIEAVAASIADLGLDVDVVAGSSPQTVEVFVPGYFVDTSEARDLGWVRQEWTTLGAAERVVRGLTSGTVEILVLGILAGLVSAAAIQVVQAATRRREIAILISSGWSQRNVWVWIMSEAALAAVVVLVLGLIAWFVAGGGALPGLAASLVATMLLIAPAMALRATKIGITTGTIAVQGGDLNERAPRVPGVGGPVSLGFRAVVSRPIRASVMVLALAGTAAALALVATVVGEAAERAGPTRLAIAVSGIIQPSLLLTLGAVVFANVAALTAMWRLDNRARAGEAAALIAVGWSRRQILLSRAAAGTVIALPAAGLGAILTISGMAAISGGDPSFAFAVTAAVALSVGVFGPAAVGLKVDPAQRP